MTSHEVITFWLQGAENDRQVAVSSYSNNHFDWSFFQWHAAIEKLLKGLVSKTTQNPIPYTHDLIRLADLANLEISDELLHYLEEINTYNISARYDDYKRSFYRKVTQKEYYQIWQKNCQEVYSWLKNQY